MGAEQLVEKILESISLIGKFLRESVTEFHHTGAIFPTSKWAARAMTHPLRHELQGHGRKILELGPGTGSVTVKILADMQDGDELTICEINPRFMDALKKTLRSNPDFIRHKQHVRFFVCAAQDLPEDRKYDVVVCALPFLNFDITTVRQIFTKLQHLSTDKTLMTNFEYLGLRRLGQIVSPKRRRLRIYRIDRFFEKACTDVVGTEKVWLNVLPINIYTRRFAVAA